MLRLSNSQPPPQKDQFHSMSTCHLGKTHKDTPLPSLSPIPQSKNHHHHHPSSHPPPPTLRQHPSLPVAPLSYSVLFQTPPPLQHPLHPLRYHPAGILMLYTSYPILTPLTHLQPLPHHPGWCLIPQAITPLTHLPPLP